MGGMDNPRETSERRKNADVLNQPNDSDAVDNYHTPTIHDAELQEADVEDAQYGDTHDDEIDEIERGDPAG
jgi:hypothetical protein